MSTARRLALTTAAAALALGAAVPTASAAPAPQGDQPTSSVDAAAVGSVNAGLDVVRPVFTTLSLDESGQNLNQVAFGSLVAIALPALSVSCFTGGTCPQ